MNLKERLTEDMKTAMKSKDKVRTSVVRMLLSEIKYAQAAVNVHEELDEATVIKVVSTYHKRLTKSLEDYPEGEQRSAILGEIKIVDDYLPKRAGADEVAKIVDEILGATADRQFGTLMKQVMAKLGGAADGKVVSDVLKSRLG